MSERHTAAERIETDKYRTAYIYRATGIRPCIRLTEDKRRVLFVFEDSSAIRGAIESYADSSEFRFISKLKEIGAMMHAAKDSAA